MDTTINREYSTLDRPEILSVIFHPRKSIRMSRSGGNVYEVFIPVDEDVEIGSRLYCTDGSIPTILFFHGNGEIAADYHEIGQLYAHAGINFWVVEYRGYGCSTGTPTCTAMMHDCHDIFQFVQDWRKKELHAGPLIVMGRSLGSAPALELAYQYTHWIDAVIIESGFAYLLPLLQRLGIHGHQSHLTEANGFQNLEKIKTYPKPTLIIHAEHDHLIPFSDGQSLYDTCPARQKTLLKIPHANHNNIFLYEKSTYMAAVKNLVARITS